MAESKRLPRGVAPRNDNKYHNVRVRGYQSGREAERARELRLLQKAGKIQGLREQVRFELIPAVYEVGAFEAFGDSIPLYEPPCKHQAAVTHNEIFFDGVPPVRPFRPPEILTEATIKRNRRKGKCVERSCEYVADFVYFRQDKRGLFDELVVEDAKGCRTKDYIIKRKLMLWVYGIRVKEV